ncbi:ATP-dependent DNA helicase [Parvularcula bermudensis HTCC2503]|uniref:Probable DNA 3'-5' helicase RecG n=1 Tax=Parvularcula bermudensis (strain ATCC BAA-594 / HTCC2503 / KCTC 12087) TaxID=314260 RepID=E0TBH9_PARBH|nr:ATP-dependent DNA helicase RecG [Parvularcula bermudensis]ADM08354.1 ATP-dependent DNA helicase [Parvularcula bermudensis HTCC2503]
MRPAELNRYFADLTSLPGVGPKTAALLQKVAGPRIIDLLLTGPTGLIDRSYRPKVGEAILGRVATVTVTVTAHTPPPTGRRLIPYRILTADDTGYLTLVFFRAKREWLETRYPVGTSLTVSGTIDDYGGARQMTHPDYMLRPDHDETLPEVEPVYPLTAGLTLPTYRRAVAAALRRVAPLAEWRAPPLEGDGAPPLPDWADAVRTLHAPQSERDLSPSSPARRRLAADELLSNQLALSLIRHRRQQIAGRALPGDPTLMEGGRAALPFRLTAAQDQALAEIVADMQSPARMVRLLQGDVGSGKTMVAFFALLQAIGSGVQGALMAPTEILALQHEETLRPLCDRLGLSLVTLLGRDKGPERAAKRRGVAEGYVPLVIGTHALLSEDVVFRDLGLIVVDEQHRFGVTQRLSLQEKGRRADILVMTATPIPRSLALTTYGDMSVSQIREKPPGRKPVATRALPTTRLDEVMSAIGRAAARGDQIYWVCPLVEENDQLALTSVTERAASLADATGLDIAAVHGRMSPQEKDAVVARFARGDADVLVATTVIEVGVNTPNATIMVIEHAERFGLAQLHQLRGRVGRGDKPSSCLLLYSTGDGEQLGKTAKARLNTLRETEDGFVIAEADLALRGPGDALGTAQSGQARFRFGDLSAHKDVLEWAHQEAADIVRHDPYLDTKRGAALRTLLYLFGQDEAARRLRSG